MSDVRHFVGLDLGPPTEPTAVAVLERRRLRPGGEALPPPAYALRHLERFPPGTQYPDVVAATRELLRMPPLRGAWLLADATAVGWAVQELVCDGLRGRVTALYSPVVLSGGGAVEAGARGGIAVPKADVVGTLQVLLQTRRLAVPAALAHADELARGLAVYRPRLPLAGSDAMAWRDGRHDDLVLAVALAAWAGEAARPRARG